jgi:WD40 repeat protein
MKLMITTLVLFVSAGTVPGAAKPLLVLHHRGEVTSTVFSPDGKILAAAAGFQGIVLWDATTGREIRRIKGENVGDFLAFSPDGKTLASARNWQPGKEGGTVYLWNVATGKQTGQLTGNANLVRCVAFSPDGKRVAGHSQWSPTGIGAVRVWDRATGKELLRIPTHSAGHTVAFSPDGKRLAYDVEYTLHLCEATTGKLLRILRGHQEIINARGTMSGYVNALAFSPDGKRLASASCDNLARIWEVASGKTLQVLEGHKGFVNAIAFFPDGKMVATGGEDGTIRFWEVATGRQVHQIQAHQRRPRSADQRQDVFGLAFSPDGKHLVSGGRDQAVKVWDVSRFLKARQP